MDDGGVVPGWRLLAPAGYDVLWTAAVLLLLALLGSALAVWVRRRRAGRSSVLELALILVVPVVGPLGYLTGEAVAHRARRAAPTAPRP